MTSAKAGRNAVLLSPEDVKKNINCMQYDLSVREISCIANGNELEFLYLMVLSRAVIQLIHNLPHLSSKVE